ncbi:hypothetical protein [Streptomyces sp. NPDC005969]|uniref:hypothetical protein n=1 Tax=Streptomyces sp. NPDC005969 TaxID=3156722 RepID=UPI0033FE922C
MNDPQWSDARRAVRLAANRLAEAAPALTAGSADALHTGLASRTNVLRQAALAAWHAGVPAELTADDGQLSLATVQQWIAEDDLSRHTPPRQAG